MQPSAWKRVVVNSFTRWKEVVSGPGDHRLGKLESKDMSLTRIRLKKDPSSLFYSYEHMLLKVRGSAEWPCRIRHPAGAVLDMERDSAMNLLPIFKHAVVISFFVFVMMLLVDFLDTVSQMRANRLIRGGRWRQYSLAAFLGATPGCLGAFMNVSLYIHGVISFGALVGGMIATSGDEAFVMLTQFPAQAVVLFVLLLAGGVLFAWISDRLIQALGISPSEACREDQCIHCRSGTGATKGFNVVFGPASVSENFRRLSFTRFLLLALIAAFAFLVSTGIIGPAAWDWKRITFLVLSICAGVIAAVASEHYLHYHIWDHILKRHLFRVFCWSFGALLFIHWSLAFWNLESFIRTHMVWVLLISALVGIVPESGPHMIFVMMYAEGMIPFSVLFTTSFVQDGHGMLPLLSYSVKDFAMVKGLNLIFGLVAGGILFAFGF